MWINPICDAAEQLFFCILIYVRWGENVLNLLALHSTHTHTHLWMDWLISNNIRIELDYAKWFLICEIVYLIGRERDVLVYSVSMTFNQRLLVGLTHICIYELCHPNHISFVHNDDGQHAEIRTHKLKDYRKHKNVMEHFLIIIVIVIVVVSSLTCYSFNNAKCVFALHKWAHVLYENMLCNGWAHWKTNNHNHIRNLALNRHTTRHTN